VAAAPAAPAVRSVVVGLAQIRPLISSSPETVRSARGRHVMADMAGLVAVERGKACRGRALVIDRRALSTFTQAPAANGRRLESKYRPRMDPFQSVGECGLSRQQRTHHDEAVACRYSEVIP
jgi:hypothetical protein